MVHAVAMARAGRGSAEDLVQDVFLKAMARLGELREAGAFGGWLCAITRNAAASLCRTRRPQGALPDLGRVGSAEEAGRHAEAEEALDAVLRLPEAYRETLLMRLVEGMSGPEIAARTGMTPRSVRVNLHRGMALLRERLGAARQG